MTGGNPEKHRILEIYALKYFNHNPGHHYHQLVNPQRSIPPILRRITGIYPQMVANSPPIDQVMDKFVNFIEDNSVLVAHNVSCDLKFIHHYSQKILNHTPTNFFLCTHLLAEKLFPESDKKSLKGLCQHLNLPRSEAHRAKNDVLMTLALFKQIITKLIQLGHTTLESALRFQGDYETLKRLGWMIPQAELKSLPNSPGVYCLLDKTQTPMMWGTAFSLTKHLHHLPQSTDLSRSQYRRIMQATHLTTIPCEHFLDACLYPLNHPSRFPKRLKQPSVYDYPRTLHLSVQPVLKRPDCFSLTITQASSKAVLLFGPISKKEHAQSLIQQLTQKYPAEQLNNQWIIRPPKPPLMMRWISSVIRSQPQYPYYIDSIRHFIQTYQTQDPSWHDLSSIWGFIIAPIHRKSAAKDSLAASLPKKSQSLSVFKIYPLNRGQLGDPIVTHQPFSVWKQSPSAKQLMRTMKQLRTNSHRTLALTRAHAQCSDERLLIGLWAWLKCHARSSPPHPIPTYPTRHQLRLTFEPLSSP